MPGDAEPGADGEARSGARGGARDDGQLALVEQRREERGRRGDGERGPACVAGEGRDVVEHRERDGRPGPGQARRGAARATSSPIAIDAPEAGDGDVAPVPARDELEQRQRCGLDREQARGGGEHEPRLPADVEHDVDRERGPARAGLALEVGAQPRRPRGRGGQGEQARHAGGGMCALAEQRGDRRVDGERVDEREPEPGERREAEARLAHAARPATRARRPRPPRRSSASRRETSCAVPTAASASPAAHSSEARSRSRRKRIAASTPFASAEASSATPSARSSYSAAAA